MNECPMKSTIQRQLNESGEANNYLTGLFQGDICHTLGDIQARRINHNEKENIQSEFTADCKLKPSTLYRKKIADIENRSFVEIEEVQVDHLRASKNIIKICHITQFS